MAKLPIVRYPDKRLRQKCVEISLTISGFEASPLSKKFSDMEDTLESIPSGLALAANQVGLGERLIVFRQDGCIDLDPWIANPVILSTEGEKVSMEEGCLSLPGYYKQCMRWGTISVQYEAIRSDGPVRVAKTLTGLSAQCFQHEIDHLDGVMFVDDMPKSARERLVLEMAKKRR